MLAGDRFAKNRDSMCRETISDFDVSLAIGGVALIYSRKLAGRSCVARDARALLCGTPLDAFRRSAGPTLYSCSRYVLLPPPVQLNIHNLCGGVRMH